MDRLKSTLCIFRKIGKNEKYRYFKKKTNKKNLLKNKNKEEQKERKEREGKRDRQRERQKERLKEIKRERQRESERQCVKERENNMSWNVTGLFNSWGWVVLKGLYI